MKHTKKIALHAAMLAFICWQMSTIASDRKEAKKSIRLKRSASVDSGMKDFSNCITGGYPQVKELYMQQAAIAILAHFRCEKAEQEHDMHLKTFYGPSSPEAGASKK